jgi:alkanesulfonate monooxygenase SsuD/methylene tetrahydromethanopterin reductase-like flavin-dependent oxidoreductase (luciferase family)
VQSAPAEGACVEVEAAARPATSPPATISASACRRRNGQGDRLLQGQCTRWGWQPKPHQIIYRANILIAETGEKAQQALAQYPRQAVFPLKAGVAAELLQLDQRNVAGEGRRPGNVNRALPINFCGGPDEIVAQLKEAREQIGVGVVDLSFQTPGSDDPDELMEALELFGKKVLPHIRDI